VREAAALEEVGYNVIRAVDALDGLKKLYEEYPDLIIMARELSMVNGEDPCLRIRQACYLPIIALGSKEDAVEILELGADAYITKPPNLRELVARVQALLRRKLGHNLPRGNPDLETRNLPAKEENSSNGLTRTEFRLASCLMLNRGRLLGHRQIISEVWGGKKVNLDTLHFYIRRLRQKLQGYPLGRIVNLRGVGYWWEERQISNRNATPKEASP